MEAGRGGSAPRLRQNRPALTASPLRAEKRGGRKLDTPRPQGRTPLRFFTPQDLRPGRNLTSCRGILRLETQRADHNCGKDCAGRVSQRFQQEVLHRRNLLCRRCAHGRKTTPAPRRTATAHDAPSLRQNAPERTGSPCPFVDPCRRRKRCREHPGEPCSRQDLFCQGMAMPAQ